ncbi:MAG: helix-turn-helix transcriptional regulator [Pseudomonadota bacterium]|nr:helix-turn-helix transcriptional regulator [Pseudomonadota bacterium]
MLLVKDWLTIFITFSAHIWYLLSMGTYLWETIKEIRESHGLNKRQFADILGCSPTLIGYIEKPYSESHRVATVDIIHAIAKHFTNSEDERKALEHKLLIKRARVPLEQQISDDEFLKELRGDNNAPPAVAPAYNSMPLEFIKLLQKDVNAIIASGNSHKEIAEDKNIAMILRGELCIDADGIIAIANKYGFSPDKYLVLAGYIPECILRLYNHDAFRFLFDNIDNLTDAEIDAIGNSMKVLVRALLNAKNPDSKQQ